MPPARKKTPPPAATAPDYAQLYALALELLLALELCLESDGLTWEAEQEAELVCAKAVRMGLGK